MNKKIANERKVHIISLNEFLKESLSGEPLSQMNEQQDQKSFNKKVLQPSSLPIPYDSKRLMNVNQFQSSNENKPCKNLKSLIGFSSEAEQGFEVACESAYTRSKIGELKFKYNASNKFKETVKDAVKKHSKADFINQNGIKQIPPTQQAVGISFGTEGVTPTPVKARFSTFHVCSPSYTQSEQPASQKTTEFNEYLKQKIKGNSQSSIVVTSRAASVNKISRKNSLIEAFSDFPNKIEDKQLQCEENIQFRESSPDILSQIPREKEKNQTARESTIIKCEGDEDKNQKTISNISSSLQQKIASKVQGQYEFQKSLKNSQENKNQNNVYCQPDQIQSQNASPIRSSSVPSRLQQSRAKSTSQNKKHRFSSKDQLKTEKKIVKKFLREKSVDVNNWPKLRQKIYFTIKSKLFPEQVGSNFLPTAQQQSQPSTLQREQILQDISPEITIGKPILNQSREITPDSPFKKISKINTEELKKSQSLRQEILSPEKRVSTQRQPQTPIGELGKASSFSTRHISSPNQVEDISQTYSHRKVSSRGDIQSPQNLIDSIDSSRYRISFKERMKNYYEASFQNKLQISQVGFTFRSQTPASYRNPSPQKSTNQMMQTQISQASASKVKGHQMMNSLCFQQMKKIKDKATDAQKQKLSEFCSNMASRKDLKYQGDTPLEKIAPEYKLHKMNYIPRGNAGETNQSLKKVLETQTSHAVKESIHLSSLQRNAFYQVEKEKKKLFEEVQKLYLKDKKIVETDGKDVKDNLKAIILKDSIEKNIDTTDYESLKKVLNKKNQNALERSLNIPPRWPKIRSQMLEFIEKANQLGLTLTEVCEQKLFAQVPYARENSKEFFQLVKNNQLQAVSFMLQHDKYLVYCYDRGMNTPLQWACKRGYFQIAQRILQYKPEIDHANIQNKCALEYSCQAEDMKTAALLIAHRANPWRKGKCVLNGFLNQFPLERQLFLSAKKVHFMKILVLPSQRQRVWQEFAYMIYKRQP